jgi:16S rRNA (cytosine1407-C5)-methyltransferase
MTEQGNSNLRQSLQRFNTVLSDAEIESLVRIQGSPLPTGIRLNPLKTKPDQAIKTISQRYGWQAESIPFCDNAWTIRNPQVAPGNTIEHRMGWYYLQDAASMVPVSLFAMDSSHPLVLDMAASPGGKTTHLIDRTLDHGLVFANDASKGRIPALRSVLSTWGGANVVVTSFPGESFGDWYPEMFDIVLLDAPCSMENLRPTSGRPLRETTTDERLRLQARQIQLLISGLKALKPRGQLVYATCSLAPEEDEAVLDAVLNTYFDKISIQDVSHIFTFPTAGLTEYQGTTYHPLVRQATRLWPHLTGMSGFFCALLTKHGPIGSFQKSPPNRIFSKTGLEKAPGQDLENLETYIMQSYGMSLKAVLEQFSLDLYQRQGQLYLIPTRYLDRFITLPYEYIGLPLGRWIEDTYEPSHEFISRFGHMFSRGMLQIDDRDITAWVSGRDLRHPETDLAPRGQYLLVTDSSNRILGMGKLLPRRLRNMLPR